MLLFLQLKKQPQVQHAQQILTTWTRGWRLTPMYARMTLPSYRQHPWGNNRTIKIKFKRKGGWIRSFKNWGTPYLYKFGYGHPTLQLGAGTYRHRYKRYLSQHCMLWAYSEQLQPTNVLQAKHVKPFNCYTLRGIRPSRYWLLKRKGKESKYTHLKSKIF